MSKSLTKVIDKKKTEKTLSKTNQKVTKAVAEKVTTKVIQSAAKKIDPKKGSSKADVNIHKNNSKLLHKQKESQHRVDEDLEEDSDDLEVESLKSSGKKEKGAYHFTEKMKKDVEQIEEKIKKIYESGKIKAPIHLSGNNEEPLIKIFKKIFNQNVQHFAIFAKTLTFN